ncbi:MAG: RNA 2'-phosphotransferase [Eggerthellaceae bacterium]|nr:RNA 2'-phosphotransferase [Eggerthellaceae bacterium]
MGGNEAYVRESRFLSLVLRHKPEEAGISLDEHGWADVEELIKGIAARRRFTREMLEEIVATDSKNRYSFNDDHTRIRANQGHSVNVDVELEPKDPPAMLYHGTAQKYLDPILEQGLLPKSRLYVHLSPDEETAVKVGSRHGSPIVLRVDAGAMHEDGFEFFLSKNGVWLTKQVPLQYLTRLDAGSLNGIEQP